MSDLSSNELLEAATQATGLDDFGDDLFIEPLERLVDALNHATFVDRESALAREHSALLTALTDRLRMQAYFARHPEIADERIHAPVIIIGRQRTGTSKLFGLLGSDPGWNTLLFWQAAHLFPVEGSAPGAPDPRIELARPLAEEMTKVFRFHTVRVDEPEMETILLRRSFLLQRPERFVPEFQEWALGADRRPEYQYLRRQLQFVQWQHQPRSTRRWLLKAPAHLLALPALIETFPDATLVMPHRDPATSIASLLRLVENALEIRGQVVARAAARDMWLRNQTVAMERFLAFVDGPDGRRVADVAYRDVVADAGRVARGIYEFSGVPFGEQAAHQIAAWERSHPQEKQESTFYRLEDYGLTTPAVHEMFGAYVDRYRSYF